MRKMQQCHVFLLKLIFVFFLGFFISSSHWTKATENMEMFAIKDFMFSLTEEIRHGESAFYLCIGKQGMAGCILIFIFCLLVVSRLWKNFDYNKPNTCMLLLTSLLFLGQLLFWRISRNVMPVYFIYLLAGAFYKEEEEKVTSVKIKFK